MTDGGAEPGTVRAARWQPSTIKRIVRQTPRVTSFFLLPRTPFVWRAGQHADVRLTAPDGYTAQRSYSIAGAPEAGPEVELAVERLEDGEVSSFFHDVAAVGDEIEIKGPLGGHFVWNAADGGPLLLIGGGSGVVPLMSMLRHRAERAAHVPVAMLYSARAWDEIIFRDELLDLDGKVGLSLAFALTREPARRSQDFSRRIDPPMVAAVLAALSEGPRLAFVCGANRFVSAASDALIAAGIDPQRIRTERYGQ
ncbi:FAD-binding oxidoreductase [Kumtagia ephedrae]|uniref:Oxidoreductase n=1 Tax=Kumtagia ephedrae TaxID=2116701 RepID=A0A2P7RMI2_9HYPH|nr:FAD-binding oxidoreductase [Mesorhizobium ephedrae]PSJ51409.1 oxidoreductase [Mesorhizobium ephedrae]